MTVIDIKLILEGNRLVEELEWERIDTIIPTFDVKPEWAKYTQMYRSGELDKEKYAKIVDNLRRLKGRDLTMMHIRYVMENKPGEPLVDYDVNKES